MTALAQQRRQDAESGPRRGPRSRARWILRAPLLPAFVFTVVVTQAPFILTLIVSSLNWNLLYPGSRDLVGLGKYQSFAGLSNYLTVFEDARLRQSVVNTIFLTASVVIVSALLGLMLAVLLDRKFLGRGLARTLLIAPFLVMPVAAALIWKHVLYNPDYGLFNGILNSIWRVFGAENGPVVDWVSNTPMPAVAVTLIWQWTPFMMLILLAGLQAQSGDILEAARVDGAGGMQIFRYMTLPHLRQYIELAVLLGTLYIVQTFDAIFSITQGGPGTATTNLPYAIYLTMFRKYEYGQAAAAGVVVVIGTIIVATFALRVVSSLLKEELTR